MSAAAYICSLGTATFDGHERDIQMDVDRKIRWTDTVGGPPDPKPLYLGSQFAYDAVDFQVTVWAPAAQAALFESYLPPYAPGGTFDLRLPGDSTHGAIPGFGTWDPVNFGWLFKKCTMNNPVESMGRKAPRVDLFGYRLDVHFAGGGSGSPAWYNERGGIAPTSTLTPPAILSRKFIAHQLQDSSKTFKPLPFNIPIGQVQHGRRRDGGLAPDHVDVQDMDAIVLWFRSIGGSPFTFSSQSPFGPGQPNSVQAVARALKVTRVGGWWEASLDLTLYQ